MESSRHERRIGLTTVTWLYSTLVVLCVNSESCFVFPAWYGKSVVYTMRLQSVWQLYFPCSFVHPRSQLSLPNLLPVVLRGVVSCCHGPSVHIPRAVATIKPKYMLMLAGGKSKQISEFCAGCRQQNRALS